MKIINNGSGIHQREIAGIEKLQELPDNWVAFTNLDISLPGKGIREIDVVIVTEDRLLLVDLKDWVGPITSEGGNWLNNGRDSGRSPVGKLGEIIRSHLVPLLNRSLEEQSKKEGKNYRIRTPRIDCAVVLTRTSDRSGISATEQSSVFAIDQFLKIVRNPAERNSVFSQVSRGEDFTSREWLDRLKRFFNTKGDIFKPGTRSYGGYVAKNSELPTFAHKDGIYAEFDVQDADINTATGVLRKWDFTKADTRFQTEDGRLEITGRERAVVAWLDDRNPDSTNNILKPRAEDPDQGVSYWQVYERRRRMKRLSDFVATELPRLTPKERIELARQSISSIALFHDIEAAHMDLGSHSVWLEAPSSVKVSHLMAASLPEVRTLGASRFQFLSSSPAPEQILEAPIVPLRMDVYSLACVVHTILFGEGPIGDPPEWDSSLDRDGTYSTLHHWFEKALDIDPMNRFETASKMLESFNVCVSETLSDKKLIEGLERYKTLQNQRQLFQKYPEIELIKETDRVAIWRSEIDGKSVLVKMWTASAIGEISKERSRVLAFLESANSLIEAPLPGIARLIDVHWTGDSIALVQEFVDGQSMQEYLETEASILDATTALDLISGLTEAVNELHLRSYSHGDIKPENIILCSSNETKEIKPILVDVLDFTSSLDGERVSRAYAPSSGSSFERDRFAVTKIVEEILDVCSEPAQFASLISEAVEQCRLGPPANGTLLPLIEAAETSRNPPHTEDIEAYRVSINKSVVGEIMPDEGKYWVSRSDQIVRIRGATEQLFIKLHPNGSVEWARREKISQTDVQLRKNHELVSFTARIIVEGETHGLAAITRILTRPDIKSALEPSERMIDSSTDISTADVDSEKSEDALSDLIEGESDEQSTLTTDVDVPLLWKRAMELESEFRVEVQAQADSVYLAKSNVHLVQVQAVAGDVDFDGDDVVDVERLDSKNNWQRIGWLDVATSAHNTVSLRTWRDAGKGSLISEGDRLRFQSRFENTSLQRRQDAIGRILRRASAAPALLDAFNPRSKFEPEIRPHNVDEEELRSRYRLNASQIEAFIGIIEKRPVGLLQGPPGTGKTMFIGSLVHYALSEGLVKNVLIASQSHEAVNNATEAVLKLFGDERDSLSMIRVGKESAVSDGIKNYHVATVEKSYKDRFSATLKQRMKLVATELGVGDQQLDMVMYFETTLRPMLNRFSELVDDEEALERRQTLRSTIERTLHSREIHCELDEVEDADVEQVVSGLYFSPDSGLSSNSIEQLRHVFTLTRDIVHGVSSRQRSFETFLAGTRQVVAGTCVGLGKESLGLTNTVFDLVIIDEAARSTPSELAVPIQAGKWVVLVGDHAQLEPLHDIDIVRKTARELSIPHQEVMKSDFERVFDSAYGKQAGFLLKQQYRMLPPIGRVVSSAFYERGLQHGRSEPIIPANALPEILATPLVWISTDSFGPEAFERKGRSRVGSIENHVEADIIVNQIRDWSRNEQFMNWIESCPSEQKTIGIICSYASQRDLIGRKLRSESIPEVLRQTIKVDTIDSYQGKENLIVILSLVRNNSAGSSEFGTNTIAPGFMSRKNRINVALSRAMDRLIIVGAKAGWKDGTPLGVVSRAFDEEVRSGCAVIVESREILADVKKGKTSKVKSKPAGIGGEQAEENTNE